MNDRTYRIRPGIEAKSLSGEMVIVDLGSGTYFGLNAVGSRIWELIGEGRSLSAICAQLVAEFDVTDAVARRDALDLIGKLLANQLVDVDEG